MSLLASEIKRSIVSIKKTNQSLMSDTETDIVDLIIENILPGQYFVEVNIRCGCSGNGGIYFGWSSPVASFQYSLYARGGAGVVNVVSSAVQNSSGSFFHNSLPVAISVSGGGSYVIMGSLIVASTGDFKMTFGSVNGAQTSTIYEQSYIKLTPF